MRHSAKGYQRGCRCPLCQGMQSYRVARQRASRQGIEYEPTAYNVACQDLTDVLKVLAHNPGFTAEMDEDVMGECAALRSLIDACNYDGRLPRTQYWMSKGSMHVGGMR